MLVFCVGYLPETISVTGNRYKVGTLISCNIFHLKYAGVVNIFSLEYWALNSWWEGEDENGQKLSIWFGIYESKLSQDQRDFSRGLVSANEAKKNKKSEIWNEICIKHKYFSENVKKNCHLRFVIAWQSFFFLKILRLSVIKWLQDLLRFIINSNEQQNNPTSKNNNNNNRKPVQKAISSGSFEFPMVEWENKPSKKENGNEIDFARNKRILFQMIAFIRDVVISFSGANYIDISIQYTVYSNIYIWKHTSMYTLYM